LSGLVLFQKHKLLAALMAVMAVMADSESGVVEESRKNATPD
jgi:hypothetical protein